MRSKDHRLLLHFNLGTMWSEVKVAQLCPTLRDPRGLYSPWNSPGQNTGVGGFSLLQRIFPAQDVGLVLHQPLLDGLAVLLNPFFANSLQTRTGPSSPLTLYCLSLAIQRHLKVLIVGLKGGSNCKIATQSTFLHRHLLCWHHPPLFCAMGSQTLLDLLCPW